MSSFRPNPAATLSGLFLAGALSAAAPVAAEAPAQPRFGSLRHDTVHVRTGPSQDYPIRWIFRRQALPVLILRDYENWRLVRDAEGEEGWVHASGLARKRTVVVTGAIRVLRSGPAESAAPVARLEPGVIGQFEKCDNGWCRIAVPGYAGWVRQQDVWGVPQAGKPN